MPDPFRPRCLTIRRVLMLVTLAWIAAWSCLPGVVSQPTASAAFATPEASDAPVPVTFPKDDGPHDAPIEWWYYTGHLTTSAGEQYGFEFVVFRGEVGGIRGIAAHFAVTDHHRSVFSYDQRIAFDRGGLAQGDGGFRLSVGDWWMSGANGNDRLSAAMSGYAISLDLRPEKPPTLHDGDGYIDYGDGESTYYYSRTRLDVSGSLVIDGQSEPVTGQAWMDHQWGDFATFREGGWDWFSIQLDDQTELMLYTVRDPSGNVRVVDGSFVAADGSLVVLDQEDFEVTATGSWTSPVTGATYPIGWQIEVPGADLSLTLTPTLLDQELDTRATTGVIYWEGEVAVQGTGATGTVTGVGYVELTGYTTSSGISTPSST